MDGRVEPGHDERNEWRWKVIGSARWISRLACDDIDAVARAVRVQLGL